MKYLDSKRIKTLIKNKFIFVITTLKIDYNSGWYQWNKNFVDQCYFLSFWNMFVPLKITIRNLNLFKKNLNLNFWLSRESPRDIQWTQQFSEGHNYLLSFYNLYVLKITIRNLNLFFKISIRINIVIPAIEQVKESLFYKKNINRQIYVKIINKHFHDMNGAHSLTCI